MLKKVIGKAIRDRRKALNITQPVLAELADISLNSLYRFERGESNPTLDLVEKVITVLGMELKLEAKKIER
ncbi:helix-turn-helix domain-containing protein [Flavihumibacter sp. UBA7668]|uniref:helix-turn-helix domain-containing protein n=1 Tax=Flavihumibacter sp. UBA7668 TaxID=1946542 RepID=UPI0025C68095|nr:helix-turn-helix domain-containing protein [Flavihumibacter sp. UBA7668]